MDLRAKCIWLNLFRQAISRRVVYLDIQLVFRWSLYWRSRSLSEGALKPTQARLQPLNRTDRPL